MGARRAPLLVAALGAALLPAAAAGTRGALPARGLAVESKGRVTLVGLDGRVLRVLAGWRLRHPGVERTGQVELRDGSGRAWELRAGRLARVPAGTVSLPDGYALRFAGSWTLRRGSEVVERIPRFTHLELDATGTVVSLLRVAADGRALAPTRVLDLRTGAHRTIPAGCRVGASGLQLCGNPYSKREDASIVIADGTRRILAGPAESVVEGPPVGEWASVEPSPDGRTLLAQWVGACEIPAAYRIDRRSGQLTPLGKRVESRALGWSGGSALVSLPLSVCTGTAKPPGVYAFRAGEPPRLVYRLPAQRAVEVRLWR